MTHLDLDNSSIGVSIGGVSCAGCGEPIAEGEMCVRVKGVKDGKWYLKCYHEGCREVPKECALERRCPECGGEMRMDGGGPNSFNDYESWCEIRCSECGHVAVRRSEPMTFSQLSASCIEEFQGEPDPERFLTVLTRKNEKGQKPVCADRDGNLLYEGDVCESVSDGLKGTVKVMGADEVMGFAVVCAPDGENIDRLGSCVSVRPQKLRLIARDDA